MSHARWVFNPDVWGFSVKVQVEERVHHKLCERLTAAVAGQGT